MGSLRMARETDKLDEFIAERKKVAPADRAVPSDPQFNGGNVEIRAGNIAFTERCIAVWKRALGGDPG